MRSLLLPVEHVWQARSGECLPACVAMILGYQQVRLPYAVVRRMLGIVTDVGTPAPNVRRLVQYGFDVVYRRGTLRTLHDLLLANTPPIVFVKTRDLPYWDENVDHAVVVVGMDGRRILLNDPAFAEAPIEAPLGDFDLAWLERDEMYAVITHRT